MKTPEEIKRGLEYCHSLAHALKGCSDACPYWDTTFGCGNDYLMDDALAYIRQLERERDATVADLGYAKDCDTCKHNNDCATGEKDCRGCQEKGCPCLTCKYEWRGVEEDDHASD